MPAETLVAPLLSPAPNGGVASPAQYPPSINYPGILRTSSPQGSSAPSSPFPNYDIIPPIGLHRERTLVLCFDGTGDQFDADNSNIVQFFSMLKKDDKNLQLVYYQAGIGTYTIPQIARPGMAKFSKTVDAMIGIHLDAHVMGGYEFLMQNYQAGDKICIFGFSRGAYTARALAGMIHKVGLLPTCNHQQVPFAYNMYSRDDDVGWQQSNAFKKAFSIDVTIEFLGVWDTVSSVGIIPRKLPFTKSNTHVRCFRHAISLDERRARFHVNLWNRPTPEEVILGVQKHEMPRSKNKHHEHEARQNSIEQKYSIDDSPTDVEEVWFAGCHCDVGGGSVLNGTRQSLARIPLRWMIRQCFLKNTGILFHRGSFNAIGLDPNSLDSENIYKPRPPPILWLPMPSHSLEPSTSTARTLVDSMTPTSCDDRPFVSEEIEDYYDSISPIYDQLKLAPAWWILEYVPQKQRYQKLDDRWAHEIKLNRGEGRHVPRQRLEEIKMHRTVMIRGEATELKGPNGKNVGKYKPKAQLHEDIKVSWVD